MKQTDMGKKFVPSASERFDHNLRSLRIVLADAVRKVAADHLIDAVIEKKPSQFQRFRAYRGDNSDDSVHVFSFKSGKHTVDVCAWYEDAEVTQAKQSKYQRSSGLDGYVSVTLDAVTTVTGSTIHRRQVYWPTRRRSKFAVDHVIVASSIVTRARTLLEEERIRDDEENELRDHERLTREILACYSAEDGNERTTIQYIEIESRDGTVDLKFCGLKVDEAKRIARAVARVRNGKDDRNEP